MDFLTRLGKAQEGHQGELRLRKDKTDMKEAIEVADHQSGKEDHPQDQEGPVNPRGEEADHQGVEAALPEGGANPPDDEVGQSHLGIGIVMTSTKEVTQRGKRRKETQIWSK